MGTANRGAHDEHGPLPGSSSAGAGRVRMFGCAGRHSENRGVSSSTSAAGHDTAQLQVILRNRQKTGGVPKSAAIITAATALTVAGVHTARDLDPDSLMLCEEVPVIDVRIRPYEEGPPGATEPNPSVVAVSCSALQ